MQITSAQKQNKKQKTIIQEKGGFKMFKTMKKRIKNEKGLTLIELLAVVVILAIVAAIAVPAIGNIIDNSRYNAVKADATNVLNAANLYFTENSDKTTVTVAALKNSGFLDSEGKVTGATVTKGDPTASTPTQNSISTGAITYSGAKTVTITATLQQINADDQKGSTSGNKTIPETP